MTDLRSIYLVCDPLPHERLRAAHGSSRTSGSEASAVAISHWSIIIPSGAVGSFDKYELFQDHRGRIVVECCGGGRKIRYMRKTRGVGAVDDLDQHQLNVVDFGGHRPITKTTKSHADIMGIIGGDEPTIKHIWDADYNPVTNNCQNFVIQILKLIASESPPEYYNILVGEQGKVISKLWSYEVRDPPASYRFKEGVTQQKINKEQLDEFCPANIQAAKWYPFNKTAVFFDVFDLDAGYSVISDKGGWYILSGKMLEVVSPEQTIIFRENFVPDLTNNLLRHLSALIHNGVFHLYNPFPPHGRQILGNTAEGLGGVARMVILLAAASAWTGWLVVFARTFSCYMVGKVICSAPLFAVPVWLVQYLLHALPILRIPFGIGMLCFGAAIGFWWLVACAFNAKSISDRGSPVYVKRGTVFFLGHWALVVDDREYHLVWEHGRPKLIELHKTAQLPDTHGSFTGKYFIGWSDIDERELRKKLEEIERDFALACEKALGGRMPIFNASFVVWLPLYLCGLHAPQLRSRWWSLILYGIADATLLQLSLHLMQTLIDGQVRDAILISRPSFGELTEGKPKLFCGIEYEVECGAIAASVVGPSIISVDEHAYRWAINQGQRWVDAIVRKDHRAYCSVYECGAKFWEKFSNTDLETPQDREDDAEGNLKQPWECSRTREKDFNYSSGDRFTIAVETAECRAAG
ncbi:hypothetical protein C8R45DRAFT_935859 [Mycena sanguinolenta]|nr:hypothetical protein C8R45DRAFT_935859 [Mycena sanguinolenta]